MRCAIVAALAAAALMAPVQSARAHTLTGLVSDSAGAAVPGASVWLSVSRDARAATADATGHFSFAEVPTGTVQLVAFKEGLALGGAAGQCISDIDIGVVLPPAVTTRLRVINTRYAPVEGARLRRLELPDVFTMYIEDLVALGFPSPPSDAKGFLLLPPLPEGAFVNVTIGHAAYADGALPALPSGLDDLDFPLPDGVPIVGRITDGAGRGVDHARVSIYRPRERDSPLLATEVLSGPDGFYAAMAPPGQYFVAARHSKFGMPAPQSIQADGLAGEAVLNLTMPDGRRVRGHAVDTGGAAVPLAIFAYHKDNFVVAETVSDAAGRFEMVVPPGQGALHIRSPRRMTTVQFPRILVNIGEAQDTEIASVQFRRAPEVHGRVTTPDGAPADKALITSLNLTPAAVVTTNNNGEFTLELESVPDEPLRFRAEHALRFLRRDFEIDPVKLEEKEIRLREFKPEPPSKDTYWANNLKSLVGKPAPELECRAWLNLPAGQKSLHLADLRGKVVVLLLWAGFDLSDRNKQQIAEMNALHTIYKDVDDVAIVSVHDGAATPEIIAGYVRQLGVAFPVGGDLESSDTFSRYRTGYVPQAVVIDKTGALRFYITDGKLIELIKLLRRE